MARKPPKTRIQEEIDRNLRRAFDDLAEEPVPERFAQLLDRLRANDVAKGEGDDEP